MSCLADMCHACSAGATHDRSSMVASTTGLARAMRSSYPEDEDGLEEDGDGDFCSVCIGTAKGMLDQLCPLLANGRLGVAFGFLMM